MITLPNSEEELKENEYYWYYINDAFKLIKISCLTAKEIVFYEGFYQLFKETIKIHNSEEESRIPIKEKNNIKKFTLNQLCPLADDLSINTSNASILANIKLKNELGIQFAKAGKLLVGINIKNITQNKLLDDFFNFINSNHSCLQTIIVNGLPNTGKTILIKDSIKRITHEKININFTEALEFLEIFGNAIENKNNLNSSRYMRVLKFYNVKNTHKLIKVKIKHFLFEKSKILNTHEVNEDEESTTEDNFTFHIIHAILEGFYIIFLKDYYNTNTEFSEIIKIIKSEFQGIFEKGLVEMLYKEINNSKYHTFYFEKFNNLLRLMGKFQILNKKIIKKIFSAVIAILLLRKIEFEIHEDGYATLEEKDIYLTAITDLLECEHKLVYDKLISREIRTPGGSFYVIRFSLEEADRARNTFAKFLYENLFEFLTRYMNTLVNEQLRINYLNFKTNEEFSEFFVNLKKENLLRITRIVECYGIENSEDCSKNSLESLCINYTNDKLNNILFEILIKSEMELYKQEGIVNNFDTPDNTGNKEVSKDKDKENTAKPRNSSILQRTRPNLKMNYNKNNGMLDMEIESTLQALDDNTKGIFKLLDVQGSLINTNNGQIKALCDNIKLYWPTITTTDSSFYLAHFGSIVEYGADDIILKNVDTVNDDFREISNKFYRSLAKYVIAAHTLNKDKIAPYLLKVNSKTESKLKSQVEGRNSVTRRLSTNMKIRSNTEKFINSLKNLLTNIKNSNVSFIKLINTNNDNGKKCDDKYILKQIYSSGILESILLARGGYFIRNDYKELFDKVSKFPTLLENIKIEEKEEFIMKISKVLNLEPSQIIIGKNLLFIKNEAAFKNKSLLNVQELPKFLVNCLLRILLEKFLKVFKIVKYLKSIGKRGIIKELYNTLDNIFTKNNKINFIAKLNNNFTSFNNKAKKIQVHFRDFIKRKNLIKKVSDLESKILNLFLKNYKKNLLCGVKENYRKINEAQSKIQNSFRIFKAKKKLTNLKNIKNSLERIETVLMKNKKANFIGKLEKNYIAKVSLTNFVKTTDKLIKKNFLEKVKFFSSYKNEKALLIQKVFKIFKQKKIVNKKVNELSSKVSTIINKNNLKSVFNKIVTKVNNIHRIEEINLNLNRIYKKSFFQKLQNNLITNEKAKTIQNKFKSYLTRKKNIYNTNIITNVVTKFISKVKLSNAFARIFNKYDAQIKLEKIENILNKLKTNFNQKIFINKIKSKWNEHQILNEKAKIIQNFFKKFKNTQVKNYFLDLSYKITKNCFNSLRNKIKSSIKIQNKFRKYSSKLKLQKLHASVKIQKAFRKYSNKLKHFELQKINSLHFVNILDNILLKLSLNKIKKMGENRLSAVKTIQTYYHIHRINRNHKIHNFFEVLNSKIKSFYFDKFTNRILKKNIYNSFEHFLINKINETNKKYSQEFLRLLKIKNDMKLKLMNILNFKSLRNEFNKFKLNLIFRNNKVKLIQKVLRRHLVKFTIKKLFKRFLIRDFFFNFNSAILKIKLLQNFIKEYLQNKKDKKSHSELYQKFSKKLQVKILIKEMKDCSCFIKSIKSNYDSNEKESTFAINFGEVEVIDDYIEDNKNKCKTEVKTRKLNIHAKSSSFKLDDDIENVKSRSDKKKIEFKVFPETTTFVKIPKIPKPRLTHNLSISNIKSTLLKTNSSSSLLCSKNHVIGEVKQPASTKIVPLVRNSTTGIRPRIETETNQNQSIISKKQNVEKMKNINKHIKDDYLKNKKYDIIVEECTNELDSLMKEIKDDLNKINKKEQREKEKGIDYAAKNRERKKISSSSKVLSAVVEKKERLSHCGHQHKDSVVISGDYDQISFKRVCFKDELKK